MLHLKETSDPATKLRFKLWQAINRVSYAHMVLIEQGTDLYYCNLLRGIQDLCATMEAGFPGLAPLSPDLVNSLENLVGELLAKGFSYWPLEPLPVQ